MSDVTVTSFSELQLDTLKEILEWRNSNAVRKEMVNNSIISLKSHLIYVKKLSGDQTKEYYLVKTDNNIGIISLTDINDTDAELGLYKNPNIEQKGIGIILLQKLIYIAQKKCLKKLKLRVKSTNKKAISLYEKFEFSQTGKDNEYFYMEKLL